MKDSDDSPKVSVSKDSRSVLRRYKRRRWVPLAYLLIGGCIIILFIPINSHYRTSSDGSMHAYARGAIIGLSWEVRVYDLRSGRGWIPFRGRLYPNDPISPQVKVLCWHPSRRELVLVHSNGVAENAIGVFDVSTEEEVLFLGSERPQYERSAAEALAHRFKIASSYERNIILENVKPLLIKGNRILGVTNSE